MGFIIKRFVLELDNFEFYSRFFLPDNKADVGEMGSLSESSQKITVTGGFLKSHWDQLSG